MDLEETRSDETFQLTFRCVRMDSSRGTCDPCHFLTGRCSRLGGQPVLKGSEIHCMHGFKTCEALQCFRAQRLGNGGNNRPGITVLIDESFHTRLS